MLATVTTVRGKDRASLLADPNFVYVGRRCAGWLGSDWGNPFRVQRQRFRCVDGSCCDTPEEAVGKYGEWVRDMIRRFPASYDLAALRGKRLGCWCGDWRPDQPADLVCHAVILAKLANATFS